MLLNTFTKVAPKLFAAGTALELVSGPGVGKSSVMRDVAAKMSVKLGKPFGLVTNILSQQDPIDIKGFCIPNKDPKDPTRVDASFTVPSVFPNRFNTEVFVNGKVVPHDGTIPEDGLMLLDEFGQSSNETQKVCAELLLEKKIGQYRLPKGWVVWAASNRLEDKSGVVKRLSFVQNRMKNLQIEAAYEPWEAWANKNSVHPLTITFAKRYPGEVFRDHVPSVPGAYCTPRSLVLCSTDLSALREETHGDMRLPDDEVAMEVISGWVGEKTAVNFITHIRLANDLPELEAVKARPMETRVPERADSKFIMANMLAHHTDKSSVKPFMKYVQRLDVEMQVLYVNAISQRDPLVLMNEEMGEWISTNQDLLLATGA